MSEPTREIWQFMDIVRAVTAVERERCAKIAEAYRDPEQYLPEQIVTANLIAAAIRKETE